MTNVRKRRKRIINAAAVGVAILLLLFLAILNFMLPFRSLLPARTLGEMEKGEMRIYFLDVGQGDCSVVAFPDGRALVIDGGDGAWQNENNLIRFFKGLDAVSLTFVATHADADHCGGFAELIRTFGAQTLYLPAIGSEDPPYTDMVSAAETCGAEIKTAKRYEVLDFGEAYAVFLSPYSQEETDENQSSSVLYLRYGQTTALFTADIGAERETRLLNEYNIRNTIFDRGDYTVRLDDVDILKVAHHGSAYSSSEAWLDLIKPEVSVISCGLENPYGHPSGKTLSRLAVCGSEIYRTDELGDVIVSAFSDGRYQVFWE